MVDFVTSGDVGKAGLPESNVLALTMKVPEDHSVDREIRYITVVGTGKIDAATIVQDYFGQCVGDLFLREA